MSGANQTGIVRKDVNGAFMESIGVAREASDAAYEDIADALVNSDEEEEAPAGEV
jgi:hypothetical protein